MPYSDLIQQAAALIAPKQLPGGLSGDVSVVLLSEQGQSFSGVCVSSGSNTFCAEQAAIAAMITAGEYRIQRLVATWKNEVGEIFVIAPCGNCRQLMFEIDAGNLDAEIVLDHDLVKPLRELLPYASHWQRQSE